MEVAPAPCSLEKAIETLCKRVEALAPGARTGVCIASADGARLERSHFPSLPGSFQAAVRNIPMGAPYFGNCTAAMDGREIITTEDLATETRFDKRFVEHCMGHCIRSLQSRPVFNIDGKPLGTFVMGFAEPRAATAWDEALMVFAADAVTALLKRQRPNEA
jgi:GAF domain